MCKDSSVNSPSSNRQYQVLRQFVSAITGSHICSNVERDYFSFSVKLGDLTLHPELSGSVDLVDRSATYQHERESIINVEFCNSKEFMKDLTKNEKIHNKDFQNGNESVINIKKKLQAAKISSYQTKLDCLRISIDEKNKRCNVISNEIRSSNWLCVIPMKECNYVINKQKF